MKKILLLLLLLLVGSCGISKHKTKGKTNTSFYNEVQSNEKNSVNENSTQQNIKSDSTTSNASYNIDRSKTAVAQNFSLKNNGKCADPGSTRFVHFTDVLGNKTEIPVNDNTDLDFGSESEMKKEVESLKTEVTNLKKENANLKKDKQAQLEKETAEKSSIQAETNQTNIETEKHSFWSFVLVGILFIVVWEIVRRLIKKYI